MADENEIEWFPNDEKSQSFLVSDFLIGFVVLLIILVISQNVLQPWKTLLWSSTVALFLLVYGSAFTMAVQGSVYRKFAIENGFLLIKTRSGLTIRRRFENIRVVEFESVRKFSLMFYFRTIKVYVVSDHGRAILSHLNTKFDWDE